jgi:hypothetical protein
MSMESCPRCASQRLTVIYYDASGQPVGGLNQCTECGPRHAVKLVPAPTRKRNQLLDRKAS